MEFGRNLGSSTANPATTSGIFRAFGDVSLAGTPWEGSGMRQRNSGSSYTVIYGIPAIV
jgi:hypothetical protein